MKRYRLYFEVGDWERCYPLDYFQERIKEGETEIYLTGAEIDYGGEGLYCHYHGEVLTRGDTGCGRFCPEYHPRNGKSGMCRNATNCYRDTGEAFILTKDGLNPERKK